jgi:hypothetical protein
MVRGTDRLCDGLPPWLVEDLGLSRRIGVEPSTLMFYDLEPRVLLRTRKNHCSPTKSTDCRKRSRFEEVVEDVQLTITGYTGVWVRWRSRS